MLIVYYYTIYATYRAYYLIRYINIKYLDSYMEAYNLLNYNSIWSSLSWEKINERIFIIQQRIYKATKNYQVQDIHNLQNKLINSNEAKVKAIEYICKSISQYYNLYNSKKYLFNSKDKFCIFQSLFTKNINNEKIASIIQKIKQYLINLCLEPEWKAKFEPLFQYDCFKQKQYFMQEKLIDFFYNKLNYSINTCVISIKFMSYYIQAKYLDKDYLIKKINSLPYINSCIKYWISSQSFNEPLNSISWSGSIFLAKKNILINLLLRVILTGVQWSNVINIYSQKKSWYYLKSSLLYYKNNIFIDINSKNQINNINNIVINLFEAISINKSLLKSFNLKPIDHYLLNSDFLIYKNYKNQIIEQIALSRYKKFLWEIRNLLYTKNFLGRLRLRTHLNFNLYINKIYNQFIKLYNCHNLILSLQFIEKISKILDNKIYFLMKKIYKSRKIYRLSKLIRLKKIIDINKNTIINQICLIKNNR